MTSSSLCGALAGYRSCLHAAYSSDQCACVDQARTALLCAARAFARPALLDSRSTTISNFGLQLLPCKMQHPSDFQSGPLTQPFILASLIANGLHRGGERREQSPDVRLA